MKNVFTYAVKSLNAPKVNFLKKGLQMLIGADRCEVAIVAFSNSGIGYYIHECILAEAGRKLIFFVSIAVL